MAVAQHRQSGLSIVGKIVGQGKLAIFGHVEGEVHALRFKKAMQQTGEVIMQRRTSAMCWLIVVTGLVLACALPG
jgi:cytoskeletal protein CcmA (bactofilin family)